MNPGLVFLLLFVAIPAGELYLMIQVGSEIGALSTVILVLATAIVGGALVRMQGFAMAWRVRESMERGETPAEAMFEGPLLLLAGILLLLPGFVTDVVGFLLLIPPLRRRLLLRWLQSRRWVVPPDTGGREGDAGSGRRVIEGEYKREDD
jgi:UPF0716 protein FxsA